MKPERGQGGGGKLREENVPELSLRVINRKQVASYELPESAQKLINKIACPLNPPPPLLPLLSFPSKQNLKKFDFKNNSAGEFFEQL